jgi:hypothetical protein
MLYSIVPDFGIYQGSGRTTKLYLSTDRNEVAYLLILHVGQFINSKLR